ncbi:peptidylprolyl isomerase [Phytohabitans suffuscus]|uniref:Putative peptidyl-prolyl cis-trans isomerase n=1 Tax=Phytohabitans suffuscus TaxID=624315 RepID=A0A6F8YT53_9ACTN|nr:peptidylprolyl isomerase [Phytohabitans suffuscus]BCB89011.1 putative peptidyl-prolyl cis-trans isomerase [Phytohabitans suffuscus]
MASSKTRQRKMARAKYDRQMARKAAQTRRKRRVQAGVGAALALALIVFGTVWVLGGFDSEPTDTAAADICAWTPADGANNPNLKDVGQPPTKDLPTTGTRPMTITTDQGAPITVSLDVAGAPCASASFAHLASNGFYDNTQCTEITPDGALRCGDVGGTGTGGPTYSFYNENVPSAPEATPSPGTEQAPIYPKGTVALVGTPPGTNGSQFLIFFKDFSPADAPAYPIVGRVTSGLDVVETIGKIKTVDNGTGAIVKPEKDVTIQSLTVGEMDPVSPEPSAPAAGSPEATAPPTPAATASQS